VHVTEQAATLLRREADRQGKSVSAYLRDAALDPIRAWGRLEQLVAGVESRLLAELDRRMEVAVVASAAAGVATTFAVAKQKVTREWIKWAAGRALSYYRECLTSPDGAAGWARTDGDKADADGGWTYDG